MKKRRRLKIRSLNECSFKYLYLDRVSSGICNQVEFRHPFIARVSDTITRSNLSRCPATGKSYAMSNIPLHPITSYNGFWPFYLQEHSKPATRRWHFAGTFAAMICVTLAIALRNPWLLIGAVIAGYGPAWVGHFVVENNQPATFHYPLWSLISDFRMTFYWLAGKLPRELNKAGIAPRDSGS